jgi:phage tail tube protein FII
MKKPRRSPYYIEYYTSKGKTTKRAALTLRQRVDEIDLSNIKGKRNENASAYVYCSALYLQLSHVPGYCDKTWPNSVSHTFALH